MLRNHGRAKYIHRENQDSGDPFHIRLKSHYAHKADIAREALAWIEPGMVIALDASSTCWYLARQLPDIDIHVFTNSHRFARSWANASIFSSSVPAASLSVNMAATSIRRLFLSLSRSTLTCLFFPARGLTAAARSGTQIRSTRISNPRCLGAHHSLYC
ncbi:DNA-binding transcriptional activator FucR [Citrobacter koseri]|uniref:DNA-binding transcriptional activator FucR n=1 Tax=Citrobacter koseri TaxID=545 RepID=A0A2X2WPS4_CITKO|nr:DNA-binding transcriptional activator FucR [Citrobacter koseri]